MKTLRTQILHYVGRALACALVLPVGAAVPGTRAEREDFIETKLHQLPLSESARQHLRKSSWWAGQTVSSLVTMDPDARRTAVARDLWLERELQKALRTRDLRLTLTHEELRLFVERGRAPVPSLMSAVEAIALRPKTAAVIRRLGCRTMGEVRARLLLSIIYGSDPLTEAEARELRQLRHLDLASGEDVITPAEFEYARALTEARVGQRARQLLRQYEVMTLDELRRLPLEALAARSAMDKKTVAQMTSLLRGTCAKTLRAR